ncbi:hypothetical protein RCL1_004586 [Eukaryota sp. TZLM3-RCL]
MFSSTILINPDASALGCDSVNTPSYSKISAPSSVRSKCFLPYLNRCNTLLPLLLSRASITESDISRTLSGNVLTWYFGWVYIDDSNGQFSMAVILDEVSSQIISINLSFDSTAILDAFHLFPSFVALIKGTLINGATGPVLNVSQFITPPLAPLPLLNPSKLTALASQVPSISLIAAKVSSISASLLSHLKNLQPSVIILFGSPSHLNMQLDLFYSTLANSSMKILFVPTVDLSCRLVETIPSTPLDLSEFDREHMAVVNDLIRTEKLCFGSNPYTFDYHYLRVAAVGYSLGTDERHFNSIMTQRIFFPLSLSHVSSDFTTKCRFVSSAPNVVFSLEPEFSHSCVNKTTFVSLGSEVVRLVAKFPTEVTSSLSPVYNSEEFCSVDVIQGFDDCQMMS